MRRLTTRGYLVLGDHMGGMSVSRAASAAEFFVAVKDICVYKKLAGQTPVHYYLDGPGHTLSTVFADGAELMKRLAPGRRSYAFYWLETIRDEIKLLKKLGLISEHRRSGLPHGYGDDEHFRLTPADMLIIEQMKTKQEIKRAICELAESGYKDPRWAGRQHTFND